MERGPGLSKNSLSGKESQAVRKFKEERTCEKQDKRNRHHSSGVPFGQLFKVHSSKFKPHPVGDLSQTTIVSISHTVFFLSVGKDPLNCFFTFRVKLHVFRSVSGIIGQLLIVLPNMTQNSFYTVFGFGTKLAGRALSTDFWVAAVFLIPVPIGSAVSQGLILRADDAIIINERVQRSVRYGVKLSWISTPFADKIR